MNNIEKLKEFDVFLDDIFSKSLWAPQSRHAYSMAIGLRNRSELLHRILVPQENIHSIGHQGDDVVIELMGNRFFGHQFVPKKGEDFPIVEKATVYLYRLGKDLIGQYACATWDIPLSECTYTDGRYGVTLPPTIIFRPSPF